MSNTMSPAMTSLWNQANAMKVGALYTSLTRNPDDSIRATFRAEREIEGTRAWAICKCGCLTHANYSDSECAAISAALNS
ncbi:MAG: hypothetical protein C0436_04125 [Alphaproteobacteria bacterium]|nr:hypothetical protein [Alphaproteobacteria bacterium]